MNVIWIALDTVRADHVGCLGYARKTTPVLDTFARGSILFERSTGGGPSRYYLINHAGVQEVVVETGGQSPEATTGGIQSPTFSTRESETTVVVQSGETIVIGGIIDDTVDRSRTGIPFLMDIPVIGRAFRVESDNVRRTELIVLLTPHVVRDRQESRNATEAFKSRLKGMERDLYRYEQGRPDYGSGTPSKTDLNDERVNTPAP